MNISFLVEAKDILGYFSVVFNLAAAVVLIAALLPPFIDTVKSRMTYGIGQKFFICYVGGGCCMLINAITALCTFAKPGTPHLFAMFLAFVIVNVTSVTLNSWIWKEKMRNLKESKALGLSEKDYWEQYLSKNSKEEK